MDKSAAKINIKGLGSKIESIPSKSRAIKPSSRGSASWADTEGNNFPAPVVGKGEILKDNPRLERVMIGPNADIQSLPAGTPKGKREPLGVSEAEHSKKIHERIKETSGRGAIMGNLESDIRKAASIKLANLLGTDGGLNPLLYGLGGAALGGLAGSSFGSPGASLAAILGGAGGLGIANAVNTQNTRDMLETIPDQQAVADQLQRLLQGRLP